MTYILNNVLLFVNSITCLRWPGASQGLHKKSLGYITGLGKS